MNNFLNFIFGIPPTNREESRMNDGGNDLKNDIWSGNDNTHEDDTFSPIEIHKHIENFLFNVMQKSFPMFDSRSFHPDSLWEEDRSDFVSPSQRKENLRDMYLKSPGYISDQNNKQDINLDGKLKADDIENILNGKPESFNNSSSVEQYSPKIFSNFVSIRTIRRPDGSVETIKKIRDHTGREETIITKGNVNDPSQEQDFALTPYSDFPGIDFLKKFFPF